MVIVAGHVTVEPSSASHRRGPSSWQSRAGADGSRVIQQGGRGQTGRLGGCLGAKSFPMLLETAEA